MGDHASRAARSRRMLKRLDHLLNHAAAVRLGCGLLSAEWKAYRIAKARKEGRFYGRPREIARDVVDRPIFRQGVGKRANGEKVGISRASVRRSLGEPTPPIP